MPTLSTNLDLTLYDRVSDTGSTFVDFRDELAGTGNSNMVKIDTAVQDVLNSLDSAKGVGYTNQTIKGNYDDNQTNKQRIVYPANASGTNTLIASIAELTSVQNNLPIILIPSTKNTGAVTLNINTFGALPINKTRNVSGSTVYTSLEAGDLQPNMPILIIKDLTGTRYLASNFGEDFARNSFYDYGNGTYNSVQSMLDAVNVASRSSVVNSYSPVTSLTTGTKNGLVRGTLSGMTLNNAVVNGDFSSGTTSWIAGNTASFTVSSNVASFTANAVDGNIYQSVNAKVGRKYFFKAIVKADSPLVRVGIGTSHDFHSGNGQFETLYVTHTAITTAHIYAILDTRTSGWTQIQVKEAIGIDMTALGLDALTPDQMKDLCDNGYFEGLKGSDVECVSVGKNILNTKFEQGTIDPSGVLGSSSQSIRTVDYTKVKSGSTYTRSNSATNPSGRVAFYKNGVFVSAVTDVNTFIVPTNADQVKYTIYNVAGITPASISLAQLELGTVSTTYEPFKQSTLSLDKPLNRVPNGVADNYALDTGVLTQNVSDVYTLVSGDVSAINTTLVNIDVVSVNKKLDDLLYNNSDRTKIGFYISGFKSENVVVSDLATNAYLSSNIGTTSYSLFVPKGTYANLAAAQTALAGTKVLYQLATPVTTVYNKDLLAFENGTLYDNGLLPTYKQITTPLNIASTLLDQSVINESLEKRVDNVGYGLNERSMVQSAYSAVMTMPSSTKNGLVRGSLSGVTLNNSIVNGDFANGTTGWIANTGTISVPSSNLLRYTIGTINTDNGIYSGLFNTKVGNKIYLKYSILPKYSNALRVGLSSQTPISETGIANVWNTIDTISIATATTHRILCYTDVTTNYIIGDYIYFQNIFAIDMTALGLESLTADQMKDLCDNGYFEGLKGSDVEVQTVGKNLFDRSKVTLSSRLDAVGAIVASTASDISDFIKIKPSTNYFISNFNSALAARYIAYYDANKNFISSILSTSAESLAITTLSNAFYLRITIAKDRNETAQLELGSTATTFENYKQSTLSLDKPLNRVPAIADTYALDTGALTQNVSDVYTLASGDIEAITVRTNVDEFYTRGFDLPSMATSDTMPTQFIVISPSGVLLARSTYNTSDDVSKLNVATMTANSNRIRVTLTKGTTLADAKTQWTGAKILYQLATPVTTVYNKDLLAFENGTLYDNGLLPTYKQITTPLNLAGTIADQSTINEHLDFNIKSLLPMREQVGQYGVRWNETRDIMERLGDAKTVPNFNDAFPWSHIKRCNLKDDGTVSAYYGDPTFIENGTNGQVMVEIPKFYSKYKTYVEGDEYIEWWVSAFPYDGYTIDPAFVYGDTISDKIYISAYSGSLYDTSAVSYLLADEQVADFTVSTGDKLSSIALAKPISGHTQDLTIVKSRILANNRGTGWGLWNGFQVSALQKLFIIEYASFDSQGKIGKGVVDKTDDGSTNMANVNGKTSYLGNLSGREAGTDGLTSVSYRGVENMWGNIWSFVDGVNIQGNNILWMNVTNKTMVSDSFVYPYVSMGTLANANGYVSKLLKRDVGLFPIQATGSTTTRVPDYYYQATGNKVARLGGSWNGVLDAGFACFYLDIFASNRSRTASSRLCYQK